MIQENTPHAEYPGLDSKSKPEWSKITQTYLILLTVTRTRPLAFLVSISRSARRHAPSSIPIMSFVLETMTGALP